MEVRHLSHTDKDMDQHNPMQYIEMNIRKTTIETHKELNCLGCSHTVHFTAIGTSLTNLWTFPVCRMTVWSLEISRVSEMLCTVPRFTHVPGRFLRYCIYAHSEIYIQLCCLQRRKRVWQKWLNREDKERQTWRSEKETAKEKNNKVHQQRQNINIRGCSLRGTTLHITALQIFETRKL